MVYLDPHTTQEAGTVGKKATEEEEDMDRSHHCNFAQRMPLEHLDPSLALVRESVTLVLLLSLSFSKTTEITRFS